MTMENDAQQLKEIFSLQITRAERFKFLTSLPFLNVIHGMNDTQMVTDELDIRLVEISEQIEELAMLDDPLRVEAEKDNIRNQLQQLKNKTDALVKQFAERDGTYDADAAYERRKQTPPGPIDNIVFQPGKLPVWDHNIPEDLIVLHTTTTFQKIWHEPDGAAVVMLALLCDVPRDPSRHLLVIEGKTSPELANAVHTILRESAEFSTQLRARLMGLCLSRLRNLPLDIRTRFHVTARQLIRASGKLSVRNWLLLACLQRYLETVGSPEKLPNPNLKLEDLPTAYGIIRTLLSKLAVHFHGGKALEDPIRGIYEQRLSHSTLPADARQLLRPEEDTISWRDLVTHMPRLKPNLPPQEFLRILDAVVLLSGNSKPITSEEIIILRGLASLWAIPLPMASPEDFMERVSL